MQKRYQHQVPPAVSGSAVSDRTKEYLRTAYPYLGTDFMEELAAKCSEVVEIGMTKQWVKTSDTFTRHVADSLGCQRSTSQRKSLAS